MNEENILPSDNPINFSKHDLHFQEIYDLSPFPLLILDREGHITFINKNFSNLISMDSNEMTGRNIRSLITSDSLFSFDEFLESIHNTNSLKNCEVRIMVSNYKIKFLKLEGVAENGKCIVTAIDITEMKMLELTSLSVQADLLSILEAIPELLFDVDLEGKVFTFHSKRKDLLYFPADKIIGKQVNELLPPNVAGLCMNAIRHANEHGHTFGVQYDLEIGQNLKSFEMSVSRKIQNYLDSPRFLVMCRDITSQKKIEIDLIRSEARYRGLFDNLNVGTVVHSPDTSILMMNERASELLGEVKHEFLGKKSSDPEWHFILEDNTLCPQDLYPIHQILKTKKPIQNKVFGIYRKRTRDIVWVNVNGFPILDKTNNILEIVISFIDITDRKKIEDTLRISEANMKAVLDNSTDAILFLNHKHKVQFFNLLAKLYIKNIFGIDLYHDLDMRNFLESGDLADFEENFGIALDGKIVTIERVYRYRRQKNWFFLQYAPVKNENNETVGVMIIARDIDPDKKIQLELKQSEIKFHTIFDKAPLGIILIESKSGKIIQSNQKFLDTIQYSTDEIKNLTFQEIIYPDDLLQNLDKFRLFLDPSISLISMEIRCFRKDKSILWVNVNYVPFNIEDIDTHYHIAIFSDITDFKITEEKNKAYLKTLEKLNATKDKFFNIIAHDLRNPFTGISGLAEMLETKSSLESTQTAKENQRIAHLILTASKSAYALLENLMQWAKSQTGEIQFSPNIISLDSIIYSALQVVSVNAFKKNISIKTDIKDSPKVLADSSMTEAILRNLLTNAIKFSYINGEIILRTKIVYNYLEISITDHGIGIEEENIEKLFRIDSKFTKLGTNSEKGTGLGLVLCKEFVQKQGGDIWVTSKIGLGSTFVFTLPIGVITTS